MTRLSSALGCGVHDLLPVTAQPDFLPVVRNQVRRQIDALLRTDDSQTLSLLDRLLVMLSETTPF